jgi:hypothetical protein
MGTSQVSYTITVKANFGNKLSATNVVLRIPTPLNTTTVDCKVLSGKAKYAPSENVVVWKYVVCSSWRVNLILTFWTGLQGYREVKSVL